jgi:hypothetical protein
MVFLMLDKTLDWEPTQGDTLKSVFGSNERDPKKINSAATKGGLQWNIENWVAQVY